MSAFEALMDRARRGEPLPGTFPPDYYDGYLRGGWDDVTSAYIERLITDDQLAQISRTQSEAEATG